MENTENMKNPEKYEQLSALMDGEILYGEVSSELIADDGAQRTWYEYHLIRDCLKKRETADIGKDLPAAFRQRLRHEKLLHPQNPVRIPANQSLLRKFGMAAGVAAVALIVWQVVPQGNTVSVEVVEAPAVQTLAVVSPPPEKPAETAVQAAFADFDNPYLLAHQQAMNTGALMRVSDSAFGEK